MKYLFIVLMAFVFLFLNFYVAPAISFYGIGPDFILIFLACISPHIGITTIPLLAVLLGAAFDTVASGGIFINLATYVIVSVILVVGKIFIRDIELPICIVGTALFAIIKGFVVIIGMYVLELSNNILLVYFLKQLPSALYCALLAVPIYFLCKWLCNIKIRRNDSRIIV